MSRQNNLTENDFELVADTVHIWHLPALSPPELLNHFVTVLSERERDKFGRLKQRIHQQRQIEAQAKMRIILGRYLNCAPNTLKFDRMAHGKPYLADQAIRFNLSHSGDQGLLAVSKGIELGIDLECWQARRQLDRLVDRYFSASEIEGWHLIPESERESAFFNQWTRKEAFMKATGRGLGLGLNKCSFSWHLPSRLLACPEEYGSPDQWQLYSVDVGPQASASLIVQAESCHIRHGQWSDQWLEYV